MIRQRNFVIMYGGTLVRILFSTREPLVLKITAETQRARRKLKKLCVPRDSAVIFRSVMAPPRHENFAGFMPKTGGFGSPTHAEA